MSRDKRIFSEAPDPPIRFSVRAKMIALLTIALSVVFGAIFIFKLIDGDELISLYKDGERDPDGFSHDPRYHHALSVLQEVHMLEPRAFPYAFVVGDQPDTRRANKKAPSPECVYLVDVYATIDPKKAAPFLESDTGSEWTLRAWNEKRLVERPDLYTDRFGRWMSSYAPIRNKSGEVVALMGADFEADYVENIQSEMTTYWLLSRRA